MVQHLHARVSASRKYQTWWCMTLIPAVRKQKQVDFHKFKARLVSVAGSRPTRATVAPCFKFGEKKKKEGKFFSSSRNSEEMSSPTADDYGGDLFSSSEPPRKQAPLTILLCDCHSGLKLPKLR